MTYSVRPAQRSNAKPLIGVYAQSGAGKTYTALMVARGFVGPKGRIVMIETEGGRGESYADPIEYPEFAQHDANGNVMPSNYEIIPLRDSFSAENYGEAIAAANRTHADALIIDSASHEWEGADGVLDAAAKNQEKGLKGVLVWQQPKISHQRHFMNPLMQTPIPLVIVCMRAKYPMEERPRKNGAGKEWVRSEQLEPKQSEDILYEMFVHFWIDMDHNVHVTKSTAKSLFNVFVDGKPVTIETGRQLAAWAGQRRESLAAMSTSTATSSGPSSQSGAAPATTQSGGKAALDVRGPDGAVLSSHERGGAWMDAFEALVHAAVTAADAGGLWDHNQDIFYRLQSVATKREDNEFLDRCNAIGKLAIQKAQPPAADADKPKADAELNL